MAADPGFNPLSVVLPHAVKANLMNKSKFFIQFWFSCVFDSWVSINELACMLLFLPVGCILKLFCVVLLAGVGSQCMYGFCLHSLS